MRKLSFLAIGCLAACSVPTPPPIQYVDVPKIVYPSLPPVVEPQPPQFLPFNFILPEDDKGNPLPYCTPETFDINCTGSNVYIGMDESNYTHWKIDLQMMHNYVTELQTRIDQENTQRAQWQQENNPKPAASK